MKNYYKINVRRHWQKTGKAGKSDCRRLRGQRKRAAPPDAAAARGCSWRLAASYCLIVFRRFALLALQRTLSRCPPACGGREASILCADTAFGVCFITLIFNHRVRIAFNSRIGSQLSALPPRTASTLLHSIIAFPHNFTDITFNSCTTLPPPYIQQKHRKPSPDVPPYYITVIHLNAADNTQNRAGKCASASSRQSAPLALERSLFPLETSLFALERSLFPLETTLFSLERSLFAYENSCAAE
jgi:hypothetical protein